MIYYVRLVGMLLAYTLIGAIAALILGSLCGAVGGLALASYNNLLPNAPNATYIPAAYYVGYVIGLISIFPGAAGGFLFAIMKALLQRAKNK
jgi:uncharacterized membrane protein YfcA